MVNPVGHDLRKIDFNHNDHACGSFRCAVDNVTSDLCVTCEGDTLHPLIPEVVFTSARLNRSFSFPFSKRISLEASRKVGPHNSIRTSKTWTSRLCLQGYTRRRDMRRFHASKLLPALQIRGLRQSESRYRKEDEYLLPDWPSSSI